MRPFFRLIGKITPDIIIPTNWGYWGFIKHFNTISEEYKVMYYNGTPNYITKDIFDGVQVIICE